MSSPKPPWWRAFDKLERKIGEPLESAAASNRYVDVMLRGMRLQRVIGDGVGRAVGGAAEKVLRVASIPTRADVRRINRQLAVLTSEVRTLTDEQREAREEARASAPKPARVDRRPAMTPRAVPPISVNLNAPPEGEVR